MATTTGLEHHAPAMRVGGRRMSASGVIRPKVQPSISEPLNPGVTTHEHETADYPRPEANHPPPQQENNNEEEQPKRERKRRGSTDKDMKFMERKMEGTRPTRDMHGASKKDSARGGRIGQPAGKSMGL
ncbi:hypothetical protein JAAARDRAFT_188584 [Jaapia argillacea MUCL 33604]|uniref:Uncharacterized protein n=1 Tax=Jaapia argillacea MUCL 33604 TaxID=933084 RepID=A0A067QHI7_9AGAM|nr:hypothetical protein JAAARDRAFT_188584 [Jaapia argillacea MUCL 33604]